MSISLLVGPFGSEEWVGLAMWNCTQQLKQLKAGFQQET